VAGVGVAAQATGNGVVTASVLAERNCMNPGVVLQTLGLPRLDLGCDGLRNADSGPLRSWGDPCLCSDPNLLIEAPQPVVHRAPEESLN